MVCGFRSTSKCHVFLFKHLQNICISTSWSQLGSWYCRLFSYRNKMKDKMQKGFEKYNIFVPSLCEMKSKLFICDLIFSITQAALLSFQAERYGIVRQRLHTRFYVSQLVKSGFTQRQLNPLGKSIRSSMTSLLQLLRT